MDLGEAILVMLARRKKSQTWLANEVSVSRPYMSSLCHNNREPSWSLLNRISTALDCKLSKLIAEGEDL